MNEHLLWNGKLIDIMRLHLVVDDAIRECEAGLVTQEDSSMLFSRFLELLAMFSGGVRIAPYNHNPMEKRHGNS